MQRGQAPWGELNEKIRGSSSGIEVPSCRHMKRSEYVRDLAAVDELDVDDAVGQR